MKNRLPLAGRAGWGIADQALSSLTNFALGIVVARSSTVEAFGAFSLAFSTYLLFMSASRALASEPLVIRYSGVTSAEWRRGTAAATGISLVVGIIGGLLSVGFGFIAGPELGGSFIALGVVLPGLLVQDVWRFAFFAARQGRAAFLNDLVWAIALVPSVALVVMQTAGDPGGFVTAWGASAAVAGLFGIWQAGTSPRPDRTRAWLDEHRAIAPRFLAEFLIQTGTIQLAVWAIGAVAGLAAVGIIRAAHLLLGATHIISYGIQLVATPEAARLAAGDHRRVLRLSASVGIGLAALAVTTGIVVMVLPDDIGRLLLGDLWAPALTVVPPITIGTAAAGLVAGATVGLRGLAAARRSLRARIASSSLLLAFYVTGAAVGGAVGAAWGAAASSVTGAAIWWRQLGVAVAEFTATASGDDAMTSTLEVSVDPATADA
jgi:O-antigen/teichoic acid export membrane protein